MVDYEIVVFIITLYYRDKNSKIASLLYKNLRMLCLGVSLALRRTAIKA